MEFDDFIAQADRALGRLHEGLNGPRNASFIQRFRRVPVWAERMGRRADRLPWVLLGQQRTAALPRALGRSFAARMAELNAKDGAGQCHCAGCGQDTRHRALVGIGIKADAAMRDPPAALDTGGFHHHKACTRHRKVHEVLEMPISHRAVIRRVLAHGCHSNAVGRGDGSDRKRGKQMRRGHAFVSLAGVCLTV